MLFNLLNILVQETLILGLEHRQEDFNWYTHWQERNHFLCNHSHMLRKKLLIDVHICLL